MKLEVISRYPEGKARPNPLLFVHGAYVAAWIWDEHFLPYFAAHGYAAHAVSLRGHGGSEGGEKLASARVRDYVADVEHVMADWDVPPVLIGHSLGGMVVQHVLHRRPVAAGVLMASAPPHGIVGTHLGMSVGNPRLYRDMTALQLLGPSVGDVDMLRRAMFSADMPEATVQRYVPRIQAESMLVILDLLGLDLVPSSRRLDLPVMVLGAENDSFIFRGGLDATASTYGTEAIVFPDMAHGMMLERNWRQVADRILEWMDAVLASPARRTGT